VAAGHVDEAGESLMIYAIASDMAARYPNRDLVQLSNEDPSQTEIDTTVIDQALADASAEIDGYLGGRFALPLNDVPAVLNRLACDVAMYRLQTLRPLHDMADARKRYEDAIELLTRVALGEVTLGLTADNLEPPEASGAIVIQEGCGPATRMFSRSSMKGY
jgi:phage gp36-like protein